MGQNSQGIAETRDRIAGFDRRIDAMHVEFLNFRSGELLKMPEWQRLEADLLAFSRRRIPDLLISAELDRVMYKFQNRKRIWLRWSEERGRQPTRKKDVIRP